MKLILKCGCILIIKPFDLRAIDVEAYCKIHKDFYELEALEILPKIFSEIVKCEWSC